MAHVKVDRVQQTTQSTGTGALTLDPAAIPRMFRFQDKMANGSDFWALIEHATANEFEISLCTYNAGVITRSFAVGSSSSTGGLVPFSNGTKTISVIAPAGATPIVDGGGNMSVPGGVATGGEINSAGPVVVHAAGHTQVLLNQADPAYNSDLMWQKAGVAHWLLSHRTTTNNDLQWLNVPRGVVDLCIAYSTGNVGVGVSSPGRKLDVNGIIRARVAGTNFDVAQGFELLNANTGVDQRILQVSGIDDGTAILRNACSNFNGFQFWVGNTSRVVILNDGKLIPGVDNTQSLGTSGQRWSVVFAGTGTINTSDAREKSGIRSLSPAEVAVGRRLLSLAEIWQYNDAVAEKGDDARLHSGWVAQRIVECFEAEGLDAYRYGCVGFDLLEKSETYTVTVRRAKIEAFAEIEAYVDVVDGVPILKSRSVERTRPAGAQVPVKTEAGEVVMIDSGQVDGAGERVMVPMLHFVPEEEEAEEERTRIVPDLDGEGVQKTRLNVRPTELHAFVIAAANAALVDLDARVSVLEP